LQIAWYQIGTNIEHLFYALELTVTSVLVTNIFQFGWWRCKQRGGELTHWQRWDAAYYLAAAIPMNLGMPLAVVLIYIGQWGYPDAKMWHSGSWMPNTVHGITLYVFKWLGVIFLTIGVLKATQLHTKIMKKWRNLRGQNRAAPVSETA